MNNQEEYPDEINQNRKGEKNNHRREWKIQVSS